MQPPATEKAALLQARAVTKRFGGMTAVDTVSFDLHRGEILGLIGPNGAGKTTLFDVIAGAQRPTSGSLVLDGRAMTGQPAHRRAARGLARTFQIPKPFPEMSVLDNVILGATDHPGEHILPNWLSPGRVRRREAMLAARAREILAFVTLDGLAGRPAHILSGGQKKLLELARAQMAEPALILLDEPAAGVNPSLLEVIIARILELNRRGTTFLLIEHNMDMVARLCGRVLVMASGRLLAEGPPDAVRRDPAVVEAYLGGLPEPQTAAA
jgi:branched-chain amino acid transport system ATP-binding protein